MSTVLHDLDSTLAEILKASLPADLSRTLSFNFDSPSGTFPPASLQLPAVNLHLYSAIPNMDLHDNGTVVQRLPNGTAQKVRPPAHIDCSYLVSAWPAADPGDPTQQEHQLFGEVMRALLASAVLPSKLLQGALQQTQVDPVTGRVESSPSVKLTEMWQGLGRPGKLSLVYTVTLSVPLFDPEQAVLVTDKVIKLRLIENGVPS